MKTEFTREEKCAIARTKYPNFDFKGSLDDIVKEILHKKTVHFEVEETPSMYSEDDNMQKVLVAKLHECSTVRK